MRELLGQFDVVIVGAGTAGCLLANRLSADPRCRVAVLVGRCELRRASPYRLDRGDRRERAFLAFHQYADRRNVALVDDAVQLDLVLHAQVAHQKVDDMRR